MHIDVDVLDPAVMPAVDAPDPGGIAFAELEILLAGLVDTPHCLGVELTVFDPDYDPDGAYAAEIVNTVVAGLAPVVAPDAVAPRLLSPRAAHPDPVPAQPDLTGRTGLAGGTGLAGEPNPAWESGRAGQLGRAEEQDRAGGTGLAGQLGRVEGQDRAGELGGRAEGAGRAEEPVA